MTVFLLTLVIERDSRVGENARVDGARNGQLVERESGADDKDRGAR